MGWKQWPSWLKGGLIGLVLAVVMLALLFISLVFGFFNLSELFGFFLNLSFQLSENFAKFLGVNLCNVDGEICHGGNFSFLFELVFPWLIYFIIYFIIGTPIGWTIGKMRNRNQPTSKLDNNRN